MSIIKRCETLNAIRGNGTISWRRAGSARRPRCPKPQGAPFGRVCPLPCLRTGPPGPWGTAVFSPNTLLAQTPQGPRAGFARGSPPRPQPRGGPRLRRLAPPPLEAKRPAPAGHRVSQTKEAKIENETLPSRELPR